MSNNTNIERSGKLSYEQKEVIVDFMEMNPKLRGGKFTKEFTSKMAEDLWKSLTEILNALPGVRKDIGKWRKTWVDLNTAAKEKNSEISKHSKGTGGGKRTQLVLSDIEKRILNLLDTSTVNGHPNILESRVSMNWLKRTIGKPSSNDWENVLFRYGDEGVAEEYEEGMGDDENGTLPTLDNQDHSNCSLAVIEPNSSQPQCSSVVTNSNEHRMTSQQLLLTTTASINNVVTAPSTSNGHYSSNCSPTTVNSNSPQQQITSHSNVANSNEHRSSNQNTIIYRPSNHNSQVDSQSSSQSSNGDQRHQNTAVTATSTSNGRDNSNWSPTTINRNSPQRQITSHSNIANSRERPGNQNTITSRPSNHNSRVVARPQNSTQLGSTGNQTNKRSFATQRLDHTITATDRLADVAERKLKMKRDYFNKKLKLLEKDLEEKQRIALALEKIASSTVLNS